MAGQDPCSLIFAVLLKALCNYEIILTFRPGTIVLPRGESDKPDIGEYPPEKCRGLLLDMNEATGRGELLLTTPHEGNTAKLIIFEAADVVGIVFKPEGVLEERLASALRPYRNNLIELSYTKAA
jgi:hypothetical protein